MENWKNTYWPFVHPYPLLVPLGLVLAVRCVKLEKQDQLAGGILTGARAESWETWGSSICLGITEVNGILAIVFNRARISLSIPKKALYHTVVLSAMTFTASETSVIPV